MLVLHTLVIQFLFEAVYDIISNDGENYESNDLRSRHSPHSSRG